MLVEQKFQESESIERKARHFVRWHPTIEARLASFGSFMQLANNLAGRAHMFDYNELAKQLFAILETHDAVYLVVGGYAARAYGVPRFTDDVDLFIEGSQPNIHKVMTALAELGSDQARIFTVLQSTILTFLEIDDLPLKTDVMVKLPGLDFASAWQHRAVHHLDGQQVYLISRADLIQAKRAAGRWQDLEDVKALEATA